jgi:hypothetical protein
MKRTRITVRWNKKESNWQVAIGGRWTYNAWLKKGAIAYAREAAQDLSGPSNHAQVVVFKKDGKIQTEWTYPRSSDPARTKGGAKRGLTIH